jgi:hypothetical protein
MMIGKVFRCCAALSLLALFFRCENGFEDSVTAGADATAGAAASGDTGSLSLSIPSVASWIQAYGASESASLSVSASRSGTKALGYATKAKVEILKSDGSRVMDPVTLSVNGYYLSGSSSATLSSVPIGTGYTVNVNVYNDVVSSGEPVVSGSKSGIDVAKAASTAVSITCLPYAPTSLTLETPISVSLPLSGERWFSLAVTSGVSYYFSQDCPNFIIGLFDAAGGFITSDASFIMHKATADGFLYIALGCQGSGTSLDPAKTGSFLASIAAPILSEGTTDAPVSLALDTKHSFVSGPSGIQDTSYYRFTTSSAGTYALDYGDSMYSAFLYSGSFSGALVCSQALCTKGMLFPGLSASTTYYLKLTALATNVGLRGTGKTVSPETIAAGILCEGSVASPIEIDDGSLHAGMIGGRVYDQYCYYKFSAGSGIDYRLGIFGYYPTNAGLWIDVYNDPSFTSYIGGASASSPGNIVLAAGAACYIRVASSRVGECRYGLKIFSIAAPSFINLPVVTDGSWTSGAVNQSFVPVWYEAAVDPSTTYTISCDLINRGGSGAYTLGGSVDVLDGSRVSGPNIYVTYAGTDFTTGAVGTKIYLKVSGSTSNTGSFAIKLVKK